MGVLAGVIVIVFGLLVYPKAYDIAPNLLPRVTWGLKDILWAFIAGAIALAFAGCLLLHTVKAKKHKAAG